MEFLRRVVRAARVEGPLDPRWARPNPARMPAVPAVLVAQPIASFTERPSRCQDRTGDRDCMAVRCEWTKYLAQSGRDKWLSFRTYVQIVSGSMMHCRRSPPFT